MDPSQVLAGVARALSGIEGVRVAYVFGSRVHGVPRADSDLDLCVRYAPSLDAVAREQVRLAVVAALADELGSLGERADVVDTDRAGAGFGFRAVRDGRCALARSEAERVRFVAEAARRYDDEAPRRAHTIESARQAARRLGEIADGRR
jgi:predicted nucleotidyltransferase